MSEAIVKYNQKKEFITILQELFSKIDDLASDDKINSNEYNEFAILCKELQNAKQQIKETFIYINLRRATNRKSPIKPIKKTDKLADENYQPCPYCDKLIKNSYLDTHIDTTIQCLRQRQTKQNVMNVKQIYHTKYGKYQALNLSLKHKYNNELEMSKKILKALQIEKADEFFNL